MPDAKWETFFRKQGFRHIAGADEAGRGSLAGPVVAAAVILNDKIKGIDDSKKLPRKKRLMLFSKIKKRAIAVGVGIVDAKTIDQINIAQASLAAIRLASESLSPSPDILLVDGNCSIKSSMPHKCIIRGDTLCLSIAAASIVAKVIRDKIMDEYNFVFPAYGFKNHKGYGTKEHLNKLKEFGPCKIHRKSFRPVRHFAGTKNLLDFEQVALIDFREKER